MEGERGLEGGNELEEKIKKGWNGREQFFLKVHGGATYLI